MEADLRETVSLTDRFSDFRVGVLGDLILDVYIWGDSSRISPEAPVPVVHVDHCSSSLGGAANVMRNLVSLGSRVMAYGVLGVDDSGRQILSLCREMGIDTGGIKEDRSRPTTQKQRIMANGQQVARVDFEESTELSDDVRTAILEGLRLDLRAGKLDALIIEDYAKGLLNRQMVEELVSVAGDCGVLVGLDPHPGHPLEVSGLTLMTPNRSEAFGLAGSYLHAPVNPPEDDRALLDVAETLRLRWQPRYLLITLGAQGMALLEHGGDCHVIATRAREVFDVSGAGDTVIASFMLGLLAGADGRQAAELANHAAGIVVGKVGTVAVTAKELRASFELEPES